MIVIGIATILEKLGESINQLIIKLGISKNVVNGLLRVQQVFQKPIIMLARVFGLQVHYYQLNGNYQLFTSCTVRNANIVQRVLCLLTMSVYPVLSILSMIISKGNWIVTILVVLLNTVQSRGLKQMCPKYFISFIGLVWYTFIVWLISVSPFVDATVILTTIETLRDLLLSSSFKAFIISVSLIVLIRLYNTVMR